MKTRTRFLRDGFVALVAQVLGFVVIDTVYIGMPAWIEKPYLPFQLIFAHAVPDEHWFVGVVIGIVLGMVFYSLVIAALLSALRGAR